ncbi:MAG: hypothetical protein ACYTBJ_00960 [Planctomycetota bacterium]|jgi:hypothetical protein
MTTEAIGISRSQVVFAKKETTRGTLVFPAAIDFIRPAGIALINQVPEFTPSEELRNTLDILDEFQNAIPPGEFSVNMYCRPAATIGGTPQGDALFQSWQGSLNPATAGSLSASATTTATTLTFDGLTGGEMPNRGVILLGTEYVRYTGITRASQTATAGTLTGCVRGYFGSTATNYAANANMNLKSRFYKQAVTAPSFSLWIKTDHFLQGMSGCSVNNAVVGVNNEGAVMFTMTGQGMKMVFAGRGTMAAAATAGATLLTVNDADLYSVDARIQNITDSDTNGTSGYTITRVDTDNDQIAVSPAITLGWETSDVIEGYLPTATVIGTPIESRYTSILIDGVAGKFRSNDFTFDVPKQYITDEVGTTYPEGYVEDVRNISSDMNIYFRKSDAKYFNLGLNAYEVPIAIVFGRTATAADYRGMEVYLKRAKLKTPEIAGDGPTLTLSMGLTALGTVGEDSAELVFN